MQKVKTKLKVRLHGEVWDESSLSKFSELFGEPYGIRGIAVDEKSPSAAIVVSVAEFDEHACSASMIARGLCEDMEDDGDFPVYGIEVLEHVLL